MRKITFLLLFILSVSAFSQTQNLENSINKKWYSVTNEWKNSNKKEFIYNDNNNNVQSKKFDWEDNLQQWILTQTINYSYNENGQVVEIISSNNSNNSLKEVLTYDTENNLILENQYLWDEDTDQWNNYKKIINTFNSNNLKIESLNLYWHNEWLDSDKTLYTYNNSNLLVLEMMYYLSSGQWILSHRLTIGYNSNNLKAERISANYVNNTWHSYSRRQYYYDTNLNLIDRISSSWINNNWKEGIKESIAYNNNFSNLELNIPHSYIGIDFQIFNHMPIDMTYYYKYTGDWTLGGKVNYNFYDNTTSTNNISNEILSIYPNPLTNELSINLPTQENVDLTLFDIQGRKVFHKIFLSNQKVTISSLESGVYFYEAITNDYKFIGKLIKE